MHTHTYMHTYIHFVVSHKFTKYSLYNNIKLYRILKKLQELVAQSSRWLSNYESSRMWYGEVKILSYRNKTVKIKFICIKIGSRLRLREENRCRCWCLLLLLLLLLLFYVQGGSNMTGTDLCVNKPQSVPVIFEPPCIYQAQMIKFMV